MKMIKSGLHTTTESIPQKMKTSIFNLLTAVAAIILFVSCLKSEEDLRNKGETLVYSSENITITSDLSVQQEGYINEGCDWFSITFEEHKMAWLPTLEYVSVNDRSYNVLPHTEEDDYGYNTAIETLTLLHEEWGEILIEQNATTRTFTFKLAPPNKTNQQNFKIIFTGPWYYGLALSLTRKS